MAYQMLQATSQMNNTRACKAAAQQVLANIHKLLS